MTHPTKAEVAVHPIGVNSRLGTWTNYRNLLNYSALAVPLGFTSAGLPVGGTLFGSCFDDLRLLSLERAMEAATQLPLGATDTKPPSPPSMTTAGDGHMDVVVCRAHLEGLPLNHQLTQRGGVLMKRPPRPLAIGSMHSLVRRRRALHQQGPATDISEHGGWRSGLEHCAKSPAAV